MISKDKIYYSYEEMLKDVSYLFNVIKHATQFEPQAIIGISRGGLVPAVGLSHNLNIPLLPITWSLRDSNKQHDLDHLEKIIKPYDRILIVDDICDSGKTLSSLTNSISDIKSSNILTLKTATLYYNPSQEFNVDFCARIVDRAVDERWVVFPWENT